MSKPTAPPLVSVESFQVVGVGASAGGLEAFTRLLRSLPSTPGLALLLVQHLDPTHKSLLVEILGRETAMPVHEGTDGMPVEVDNVYVIPPDMRMGVEGGRIRLQSRGDRAAPHMPVDYLFRSLAAAYGSRAVAVVLSGSGTDGTLGVADVQEAGGVTFAQDEASAGHTSMPASAAHAAVPVDAILPPEGIAAELLRLVKGAAVDEIGLSGSQDLESKESLSPLLTVLKDRSGINFAAYKPSTIRRRVHRRMTIRGFPHVEELVKSVQEDPTEASALTRDLLIGVTRFFRDSEVFDHLLQTTLPLFFKEWPGNPDLRIWVPGCSTGEEAYSIAITVLEAMGNVTEATQVKILATDVNTESLARARTGLYPENIGADVSPERLRRFFHKTDNGYRVIPAVRDLCVFARHDLSSDPPFARMDLISSRNVLIYFEAGLQRRVIPLFHYALRPGGYLLLGQSETIGTFTDLFTSVDSEIRLFKRTLAVNQHHLSLAIRTGFETKPISVIPTNSSLSPQSGGLAEIFREADRLLAKYAPSGVIVDDNLNILQFRGDTEPYVRHPHGTASLDLLRMAREGLLAEIQDGMNEARSKNVSLRRQAVLSGDDNSLRPVIIQILPLTGSGNLRCFLVLFEDEVATSSKLNKAVDDPANESELAARIAQLRCELEVSREAQQATAEAYEAANEELKSSNEEILASNEELQSTNEELLSTKEELQSTNEELRTINEELEQRNQEQKRLNQDLRSLLLGVNVPVVVVSRDLLIRRLTVQAESAFGMTSSDVGRPLRDVSLGVVVPEIAVTVAKVIDTLQAAEFEARSRDGKWYSFRARPYESEDNRIDGAVVTAVDIDALKGAELARHDLEVKMYQSQKLESLGIMAGGVAHDLNNLLTPVIGYSDLVRSALPPESQATSYLTEIDRATRLAADLVQQILAYSGKSHREVRTVDLSVFIRAMTGLLTRAAGSKAELIFNLSDTPLYIEADPAQLSQVILNLVTNGGDAIADRGTVTIRTAFLMAYRSTFKSAYIDATDLPEGRYAVLEVTDTGSGMSRETLSKLFDPFYTTKATGRGLGLSAVLGIIRGHRGTIRLLTELGLGSTFRVLLPITANPVLSVASTESGLSDCQGTGLILVVDDDNAVRKFAAVILASAGFEVIQAVDGLAGLNVFRSRASDIRAVVIDLTMPGMTGLEVAKQVRQIRPEVPILLISGYSDEEVTNQLGGLRINGFLHKPFKRGTLLEALNSTLGIVT